MNTWDKFECDDCHRKYAFEQPEGDEIEEPSCPRCGSDHFKHLGEMKMDD